MVTEKKDNLSDFKFQGTGLVANEKRWAGKRFKEYKENYPVDNFSDLQLLEELVYRETIQERYKMKIKTLQEDKKIKEQDIVPKFVLNALNDNLNQILILKEKLGLFKERTEDEYKALQALEKKFKVWEQNHIEERKVTCPFCSEIFFLHIRTTGYIENKLKLFKNKILCNSELWSLYKLGKITKSEFSKVLNVSRDYIDFLEEKIYKNEKK